VAYGYGKSVVANATAKVTVVQNPGIGQKFV
jgi:hypothetical protein